MTGLVSLPMYAAPAGSLAAFWRGLRGHLHAAGLDDLPEALVDPPDLAAHWTAPDLLLSQTCGYPLTTSLAGKVRYLATPCYRAEGCAGPFYSSLVVVRSDDRVSTLHGLAGRRAAYNGRDSQSGYNAFRALVAPLSQGGRFFASVIETGSHRASVAAVEEGRADVAAIDAVTWALLKRTGGGGRLRVLAGTAESPGLPFITSGSAPEATVAALQVGLGRACADPALAEARDALLLDGVAVLPLSAYAIIPAMEAAAREAGYPALA